MRCRFGALPGPDPESRWLALVDEQFVGCLPDLIGLSGLLSWIALAQAKVCDRCQVSTSAARVTHRLLSAVDGRIAP